MAHHTTNMTTSPSHRVEQGQEDRHFHELRGERSSFWFRDRRSDDLLQFPDSPRKWRLGRIFAKRQFHDDNEDGDPPVSQASATYISTQVEGPNVGIQAILKIRKQLVLPYLIRIIIDVVVVFYGVRLQNPNWHRTSLRCCTQRLRGDQAVRPQQLGCVRILQLAGLDQAGVHLYSEAAVVPLGHVGRELLRPWRSHYLSADGKASGKESGIF